MATWDPEQYLKFAGPRIRPAVDLLSQIGVDTPDAVHDLGCGPGNAVPLFQARWPGIDVVGVDSSPEMLEKARAAHPDHQWIEADLAEWTPDQPAQVIFSNACFQWLPDHDVLLPHLMAQVAPGGVFAFQVPHNHDAPSHQCMRQAIAEGAWKDRLEPLVRLNAVSEPAFYYDLMRPLSAELDIWETEYLHVLEGENPVVEWTRGSALRPFLEALEDADERQEFEAAYTRLIASAYPPQPDGKTLLPFRRLFAVARI